MSTTPTPESTNQQPPQPSSLINSRPNSRTGSRPHTPLRRSNSRSSLHSRLVSDEAFPLNTLEPLFAEFSDSMATLEMNIADLQSMHDSLSRFNECFSAFLYGLNINAFCTDFPEGPVKESFQRASIADSHSAPAFAAPNTRSEYIEHELNDTLVFFSPSLFYIFSGVFCFFFFFVLLWKLTECLALELVTRLLRNRQLLRVVEKRIEIPLYLRSKPRPGERLVKRLGPLAAAVASAVVEEGVEEEVVLRGEGVFRIDKNRQRKMLTPSTAIFAIIYQNLTSFLVTFISHIKSKKKKKINMALSI
jgi:hypothetical protein